VPGKRGTVPVAEEGSGDCKWLLVPGVSVKWRWDLQRLAEYAEVSFYARVLSSWKTSRKWNTEFPFQTMDFLGVTGLTSYPRQCMAIPLWNIRTCTEYMYCTHSIYNMFNAMKM
jgi:hypothetical protein